MKIEVKDLSKDIHGTRVLDRISLSLESGYIYGLQGINGSGKTMLMRALCGLIRPTSGCVEIDGKRLGEKEDFPASVGLLLENPAFLPGKTGKANLMLLAELQGLDESDVNHAISAVGLNPNDKRKYRKYSLGMKQRLGVAGAVLGNPELIVLDEPFNALDAEGTTMIHDLILQLKNEHKLVVLACHIAEELESLADKTFKIERGSIIEGA